LDVAVWLDKRGIWPFSHADIGASRGYLLREVGAEIRGSDDMNKKYGKFDFGGVEDRQFELVTSIHVLEHTTDPMCELMRYSMLSYDYVLIEVPGLQAQGGALRFAHLWYFPPKVLIEMIVRAGIAVIEVEESLNTRILGKVV